MAQSPGVGCAYGLAVDTMARVIQKSWEWVGTRLMGLDVTLEDSRLGRVVSHLG